ncbi:sulfurtransferase complex subunit TusD [Buchnera aphidicola]|uniref:sulfurtransferase complex subunit TusD n=1 Tax=Buchnera aphidicola TaxID=9 RepID=UPI002091F12F|nr:sulfurtransferase complex subunit TusD [Buchnera aphidicola]USS94093.1 sulfurtransferase complex subunit TusD [Buchnera aphidicola (Sipha maydis)]WII23638.1 sulfurtransferase complex subunit TusD [Buchnera aphidicola (Sipha maydis)]
MIYTVIVTGPAYGIENSISALLFSDALIIRRKHIIKSVFFYCDGVSHANKFLSAGSNILDLRKKWILFSLQNKIRLSVCFSSLLNRGIIHFKKFFGNNSLQGNLDIFFKISNLEELSRDIQKSDRVVKF